MDIKFFSEIISARAAAITLPCLCLLLSLVFTAQVSAQTSGGAAGAGGVAVAPKEGATQRSDGERGHPDLLLALNLSTEQRTQIRQIHEQGRVERRAAQQRLRQAQRALYEAVYADTLNEATVQERERNLAAAQDNVMRVEVQRELSVRRVLTPEQLGVFRNLRQRAREERRDEREERPSHVENGNEGFRLRERPNYRRQNMPARNGGNPLPVPRERPPANTPRN